ncbi:flagellar basal body-associated FliL family protein [Gemmobacter sp.]|uniref:flagellar basal body-associated FliL family protein n=1 Tax=Gemmobacter sp. TaxID=1898957 RepID=UPI002AFF97B9|nr:flagellar basal body-associated FliL family protein [Gemmobacter sp.]
MTDSAAPQDPAIPSKRGGKALIIGGFLALLVGGGAFYGTWSGLIPGLPHATPHSAAALPDVAFVPLDPLIVSLTGAGQNRHLRFAAQLEVEAPFKAEVEHLRPRVLDLLNGYLRALSPAELEEPAALIRLRAQMLRRIQIITGEGRVRDLLITEFVIN